METSVVDFAPLADLAVNVLIPVLLAVGGVGIAWLGKKLNSWLGLKIEEQHRDALQSALNYGVDFATSRLKAVYKGKLTVDMKNELVALASAYAVKAVPDALKAFNVDPSTPEGRAKIVNLVEARVGSWVFDDDDESVDPPVLLPEGEGSQDAVKAE